MAESRAFSRSVEDYLKAICQLAEGREGVATSEIAERLSVAPPSVTGMIKRMAEAGLLAHERYKGVRLTDAGRRAALQVMRRHRVLETYLITKLGLDWSNVHEEAERLEHAVSDDLIERMAFALGGPKYDPHGAPIPTREGEIERPAYERLSDIPAGTRVVLRQVGDDDSERLRYLKTLGLLPMVELTVLERQPFGGPIALRLSGKETRDRSIGVELAERILVEKL